MSNFIYLRDTYATLNKFKVNSEDPDLDKYLFVKGNELPRFINENDAKISDKDLISIYHPNINNIYWENRKMLSITDLEFLTDYMKQSAPDFINISEYEMQTYHLSNDVIGYNMLYITVKDFIKAIDNKSMSIKLPDIDLKIELRYELYDFYNRDTQSLDILLKR